MKVLRLVAWLSLGFLFALGSLRPALFWAQSQQPVLQVSPTSLSFEGQVDGPDPAPQALTLSITGQGVFEWHASADVDWITLGATEGTLSGGRAIQLAVLVDPEGLATGEYQGTITIEAPEAQGSPAFVAVSFHLEAVASGTVEILVLWSGQELEAFNKVVAEFERQNPKIDVLVNSVGRDLPEVLVRRVEAGNPPDLSVLPNPGQLAEFVAGVARPGTSDVVPLDFLKSLVEAEHPQAFLDLGTFTGPDGVNHLYGVFFSAGLKSLVWYNPHWLGPNFELQSWDELITVTSNFAAIGKTAWCIGLESGAASGWPGTDWIEDIMLRTAGPEVYDQWVNHDIPWTDARVKHAWELFGQIVRNPQYVEGGPQGALSTSFGESFKGLFTSPPECYFHRQATFLQSFILRAHPEFEAGEDFDVLLFPPIDLSWGNALLGAGDLIALFRDSSAARRLVTYLASAQAQGIWVKETQTLPVNTNVNLEILNPIAAKAAAFLQAADAFRFDASDLMPSGIGAGEFWQGVLDYVGGADLCDVLRRLEESADEAYTTGRATNGVVEKGAC